MKNIMKYILILIVWFIIFIILNFYKSDKSIFEDIVILGLWDDIGVKNEYEISSENITPIDVFTTINNKLYRKIAPGCSGSFIIKFKRPANSIYKINIIEKTLKPQNLVFGLGNNKYASLQEIEDIINEKFTNTEKITIYWEWEYFIDERHDVQDTKDGKTAQRYLFEIEAIVEEQERK